MVNFSSTKYMANVNFSEPPWRTDFKNPIFIFLLNFGTGSPPGPRVSLGRILGGLSIEPFLGWDGGSSQPVLTPPPQTKACPP